MPKAVLTLLSDSLQRILPALPEDEKVLALIELVKAGQLPLPQRVTLASGALMQALANCCGQFWCRSLGGGSAGRRPIGICPAGAAGGRNAARGPNDEGGISSEGKTCSDQTRLGGDVCPGFDGDVSLGHRGDDKRGMMVEAAVG